MANPLSSLIRDRGFWPVQATHVRFPPRRDGRISSTPTRKWRRRPGSPSTSISTSANSSWRERATCPRPTPTSCWRRRPCSASTSALLVISSTSTASPRTRTSCSRCRKPSARPVPTGRLRSGTSTTTSAGTRSPSTAPTSCARPGCAPSTRGPRSSSSPPGTTTGSTPVWRRPTPPATGSGRSTAIMHPGGRPGSRRP